MDTSAFVAGHQLIQALETHSSPIACDFDLVLFRQGDAPTGIFILYYGSATLTMTSVTGETVLRMESGSGSVLGLPGLIGNRPYSLTATAHQGAHVGFVSREKFTDILANEPLLSRKVLEVLAAEVLTARRAILEH